MTNNEKKYLVPVEMDKEYAVKAGIDPNELRWIRLEGRLTEVYFVEVEDEEMYHQLMRPIWQSDKEYERNRRCMVPNGNGKLIRCTGNCSSCARTPNCYPSSYEEMEELHGYGAVTESGVHKNACENMYTSSPEDIVSDAMLLEMLWERVAELSEEQQTIIKMFSNGASDSEIAAVVGMSKSGLNYKKNQILKNLKNILSDFRSID